MPCTYDPTPEEIRASVEATQKYEQDIRNTISNLTRMLCTLCKMHEDHDLPGALQLPTAIAKWYEEHQKRDKERLAKARERALAKLDDEEIEALGL